MDSVSDKTQTVKDVLKIVYSLKDEIDLLKKQITALQTDNRKLVEKVYNTNAIVFCENQDSGFHKITFSSK